MLKKAYRLKSRGDFKRTLSGKRVCANDNFVVYGLLTGQSSPSPPRFGFIVSKKIHKRAVIRNRIKRRLRELVRTQLLKKPSSSWQQYRTLVFIARPGSLNTNYASLTQKFQHCFRIPS